MDYFMICTENKTKPGKIHKKKLKIPLENLSTKIVKNLFINKLQTSQLLHNTEQELLQIF